MKFKVGDNVKINLDNKLPSFNDLQKIAETYGSKGRVINILPSGEYNVRVEFPMKGTNNFKEIELLKLENWDNWRVKQW